MGEYHRLELEMLRTLSAKEVGLQQIANSLGIPIQSVYYGVSLLEGRKLAQMREVEKTQYALTDRGTRALEEGLPEELLLGEVCRAGELEVREALAVLEKEAANIGLGQAKAQELVRIEQGKLVPTPAGARVAKDHPLRHQLRGITQGIEPSEPEQLIKRGLVEVVSTTERFVSLTEQGLLAATNLVEESRIVDLDPELIKNGSWKRRGFKPFDIGAPAPQIYAAKKQPYRRFLDGIRKKLVSMGFAEMTGPLVELAFWNFDALFQAQNHPAREVHDTFLIKNVSHGALPEAKLVEKVASTHENGWKTGSTGWRYQWSRDEASRLVGRSQGTALSARTLAAGVEPPAKHFCVARVFRPDVLDRNHLIEFNQCEGIIADEGLNFRHLLGILRMFAVEIANESNFAFVPSYYPFTEPSVDLVAYSEDQGQWIELGGAGIFRDEVTRPLGVEIPVIAWGMGMDRLAMFNLGIDDIRELFSHNLDWLRNSKAVV